MRPRGIMRWLALWSLTIAIAGCGARQSGDAEQVAQAQPLQSEQATAATLTPHAHEHAGP